MSAITLSSKGQITLPSVIRQHLGLHTGDKLIVEEVGGGILLRPAAFKSFLQACAEGPRIYKGKPLSVEEMKGAWGEGAAESAGKKRSA